MSSETLFLLLGTFFILMACYGVLRFSNLYTQMHAATKAATVGAGFIFIAVILHFNASRITTQALLTIFFLFITAPTAAHCLARVHFLKEKKKTPPKSSP